MYALTVDASVPGEAGRRTAGALDDIRVLGKISKIVKMKKNAVYTSFDSCALGFALTLAHARFAFKGRALTILYTGGAGLESV